MSTILRAHFQEVDVGCFTKKSLKKGKRLVHSFHVSNVKETRRESDEMVTIDGCVIRETPGATSTRKGQNLYYPLVQLNKNRKVIDGVCNCKAGQGYCKHAAAICVYVNEENTRSKTDLPMVWNRPPELQLKKYSKGCTIEKMINVDENEPLVPNKFFKFQDVQNIEELANENCTLSIVIKAEREYIEQEEERELLRLEKERQAKEIITTLYQLQIDNRFIEYHAYQSNVYSKTLRLKVSVISCPPQYFSFYQSEIIADEQLWKQICFESIKQSESVAWHRQRYLRITASLRAHRIKTRKENFESLAQQFKNSKHKSVLTEPMLYGITMEPVAKLKFTEITGQQVHDVGLVIHKTQPFLAASPDGVILGLNGFELLEIKCPFTCKDTKIIGEVWGKKFSFVKYLFINDRGELALKEEHVYYTQIQLSLYVTCLNICNFFVYSKKGHAWLKISRDEKFLSIVVPKIEKFYFNYYLPIVNA